MPTLSIDDIIDNFNEIKSEWEFRNEGREFPLILDTDRHTLSDSEIDDLLAEIEISTHLSEDA